MTEQASKMTIERIKEILEGMDWTEIHKARVFSDHGESIVLYTNGEFSVQDQGTHYRDPDAAGVISYLPCWGRGNLDLSVYFEGWVEPVTKSKFVIYDEDAGVYRAQDSIEIASESRGEVLDESQYIDIDDFTGFGRKIYDLDEAITDAIEEGDWDYTEEIEAVLADVQRDRESIVE